MHEKVTQEEMEILRTIPTLKLNPLVNMMEMVLSMGIIKRIDGQLVWIEGTDKNYWLNEQ